MQSYDEKMWSEMQKIHLYIQVIDHIMKQMHEEHFIYE